MTDDKTQKEQQPQQQQMAQSDTPPINPFKDAAGTSNAQPTPEEQAGLEQQQKEAMTERD